ncbi:putative Lsm12 protein [Leptomonas seymouri]|uniref:Putative Lsm12 protein n=1 Tax=Leptomonas seymouri TaxID=5684 RepID=A0A0N1HZ22_LEPSE|nr:putative Lsm12 protein [Leptomonas seymouri]|eukprot:KPI87103.1 putative Lsm12 protein [Leptomonas seymouri]
MSIIKEDDAVGYYVSLTLVDDTKVEGTIFTYNPKEGLLVLLQKHDEQTNMKMVRTPYIKDFQLSNAEEDSHLPPALDSFGLLPSMHAGRAKSIFKHATTQLKNAEASREKHFSEVTADTPIAAVDAYLKLLRLYPFIEWNKDEGVIQVSDTVIVVGDPDWKSPKAVLVDGASDKEKQFADRLQVALGNGKK